MGELESKTRERHLIIGCFEKGYIYEVMMRIAAETEALTDRDVSTVIVEDYYKNDHLTEEHLEEGIFRGTLITARDFLSQEALKDMPGYYEAGALHIAMGFDYFQVALDLVDFPEWPFLKKFPKVVKPKTIKELWQTINRYVEIRDSLATKIEKPKRDTQ